MGNLTTHPLKLKSPFSRLRVVSILLVLSLLSYALLPASEVSGAAINVNTTFVSFGTAEPGVPQMSMTPIRVTRDTTGFNPFTVRVYTQNPDGQGGLLGNVSMGNHLSIRCWVPNFGGGIGPGSLIPPDPAMGSNFNDWWFRIPDEMEMNPGNIFTWRRLEWTGGEMAPTPVGSFDVWFAVDVRSVTPAESYSTNSLVFEIINQ